MHGEDRIAASLLIRYEGPAFFVDVGCYDPVRWSNSYLFYLKGWRGIGIDPNADLASLWRRVRPRDTFLGCAVGEVDDVVGRYLSLGGCGASNRVTNDTESEMAESGERVRIRRLASILECEIPNTRRLGLMSVDCEGMDLEVLRGNDWTRWRPKVLIAEDNGQERGHKLVEYCRCIGYDLRGLAGTSYVFVDSEH